RRRDARRRSDSPIEPRPRALYRCGMSNLRLLPLPALALIAASSAAQTSSTRTPPSLTIDQLIAIKHPSGHQWTPDGRHVWFTYDSAGVDNVWVAPADGSGPARPLTT